MSRVKSRPNCAKFGPKVDDAFGHSSKFIKLALSGVYTLLDLKRSVRALSVGDPVAIKTWLL